MRLSPAANSSRQAQWPLRPRRPGSPWFGLLRNQKGPDRPLSHIRVLAEAKTRMRPDPDRRSAGDHLAVAVDAHLLRAVATRSRDLVLTPPPALHLGVNGLAIRLLLSGRQRLLQRGAAALGHPARPSWPVTIITAWPLTASLSRHRTGGRLPSREPGIGQVSSVVSLALAQTQVPPRDRTMPNPKTPSRRKSARRAGHHGLPWLAGEPERQAEPLGRAGAAGRAGSGDGRSSACA